MAKYDKVFNEHLHKVFSTIKVNSGFTLPELRDAVFGVGQTGNFPTATKKNNAKVKSFLYTRKNAGEIKVTESQRAHVGTSKRTLYNVYIKVQNAAEYKKIPMNLVPDVYYDFIPVWNKLPYGTWISVNEFIDKLQKNLIAEKLIVPKDVSNFLWLLSNNNFAVKKAQTPSINIYQKGLVLTAKDLQTGCVKFIQKRIGEKICPADQVSKDISQQPEKVITVSKMVATNRPTIDPNNISAMDLRDVFIETTLADKELISKLQGRLKEYQSKETHQRKLSIGKVDDLNKRICILQREKGGLEREKVELERDLKNKDSTIENLRKAGDEKRVIILSLKEKLESVYRNLEKNNRFQPFKLGDVFKFKDVTQRKQ